MSLRTASLMSGHSHDVCREHPGLLVIAGVGVAASLAVALLFLAPVFELTPDRIWQWLGMWNPLPAREAMRELGAVGHWDWPWTQLAALYLCGAIVGNFIDCALSSQSIHALNGGRVSVTRGFAIALARLPAIAAWSLVDSTIGLVVSLVGKRFGFIRRYVIRTFGASWNDASAFVIPVMLNEPRSKSPLEYLRISGGIVRRTWGDGMPDMFGPTTTSVGPIVLYWMVFIAGWLAFITRMYAPLLLGGLILTILGVTAYRFAGIYRCGLYIFATEGVLPGPFNDDLFRNAWVVRGNA